MMKKSFVVLFVLLCFLTGCGAKTVDRKETANQSMEQTKTETEKETAFPATYTIPDGWVKSEEYSTNEKFFYIEEGNEDTTSSVPDNISINIGKNRYSADEHPAFRDAIVQQLLQQLDGVKATLNGSGTFTEQGYPVYIFTITENETDIVTQQYYIADDYRYCLIHLTNYTGSESADEAAKTMVDSFIWADADETQKQ